MRLRTLGAVCATSAVAVPQILASSAFGQTLALPVAAPAAVPAAAPIPGDIHAGAIELLSNRHVHFARRYHRLLGDPLTRSERSAMRAELSGMTPYKLRVETRELREDIRGLRHKLERKARRTTRAAAASSIPPQMAAIARCESGGDPRAISSGGTYRGKYQFSFSTWRTVGGTGDPAAASEGEQDRRAARLYRSGGPGQWPVCGR
jgi:hypothetical protein